MRFHLSPFVKGKKMITGKDSKGTFSQRYKREGRKRIR